MSASVSCAMREVLPILILVTMLLLLAWARPMADRAAPAPLPSAAAEPWMADAIPGVGPRTRERIANEIRAGQVPAAARAWFTP
jgi:hypothetical protein